MFGGSNANQGLPTFLEDNQFQYDLNASTQLQLFGNIPATYSSHPSNFVGATNMPPSNQPSENRETGDPTMRRNLQISLNNFYRDEGDGPAVVRNPNVVSTGLRLSYDDDERNSSVTSASGSMPPMPLIMSLGDNLRTEIDRQKEELDHYLRVQEEQFLKGVREMKQKHTASLLTTIEKGLSRRLREKELEVESMNRRNKELAEQIKQAGIEVQSWQCRARYNEYVVGVLRSNLEQAIAAKGAAGPDQAREGCGDSEVDDAASSYDPNARRRPASEVGLACRRCGVKESCVLLLPCRHLCLCKDCDGFVDSCPVCASLKTASVQVYMS